MELACFAAPVHGSLALGASDSDLYEIAIVDRADGRASSELGLSGLFHFINVYGVAPGRADDFQAFFDGSAPVTLRLAVTTSVGKINLEVED